MFQEKQTPTGRFNQWSILGLLLLSIMALGVTAWILVDFQREEELVQQIRQQLPKGNLSAANELAGDLRLQSRLSALLILNLVASGVALGLLVRAYITSEQSLRKVRVLANDVLASLNQGVITTDQAGTILSINPRGRELLNQSDDGTGIALKDLPEDHRTLAELCQDVLRTQGPVSDRDYTIRRNGTVRNLRAGCSLLEDHIHRKQGTVIHIRDVTDKTLMEQRIRRMERYMGLGSLAAGLQHEIKNPLSALSLHVQLLREAFEDENTTSIDESLHVLTDEVRRITGVLEGFRDFASIAELDRADVDGTTIIKKLAKLTEPQGKQQHIRVLTELPTSDTPELFVDARRIEQVLLNLVVNAFAAMPDGGTVTLRLFEKDNATIIEVADTGCGIPEDLRDKVFDPYFTTRNNGTGMGLALSEKIVRQHGGTIEFQTGSTGTTFTITLPHNGHHNEVSSSAHDDHIRNAAAVDHASESQ
ncbi:MAG: PAS domain S-box protein [Planctomycetaceae bacterium]|nr:PAS domain S-box protein [Planctomycetaceae bacterium]